MGPFDNAFGVHPYSMQLRLERAEIIAGNLANVDTPGFKARDIDYNSVMQDVQQQVQMTSDARLNMNEHPLMYRIPYQPSADGNSVELNVEQANFAKNTMDFQTSLTFLNMKINGLYSAIKGK
ncbi:MULTISPECIES: flagellar basal body rod protein FlgB [Shewanella]|uniref:flagellar basal body rod protein FlgB n=1 Tax=Shewanella TaxID=22 RepID=UPI00167A4621|nr:flagellar basal body rod protein FlgB [Shewanella fodinae]GGZ12802.1 flagellar basal body rod protein FlgB [Shewanella fodinae]